MAYAAVEEVEDGFRSLSEKERLKCNALLGEAAVLIDAVAKNASADAKRVVSCRIVRRSLGDGSESSSVPIGATQGSVSAPWLFSILDYDKRIIGRTVLRQNRKNASGIGEQDRSQRPVPGW